MAAVTLSRVGGVIRETGQALERFGYDLGWVYTGLERYREHIFRSQPTSPVNGAAPEAHRNVFIAPSANVTGDVKIGKGSAVFYNTVIRGDAAPITIGEGTNVQDGCTVSTSVSGAGQEETAVSIGHNVTIGHAATLRGCTLEDGAWVGIGACVMQGATVESGAMVAAGAVVLPGSVVPASQVWAGNPAKYLRELKPEEVKFLPRSAGLYTDLAKQHRTTCQNASFGL